MAFGFGASNSAGGSASVELGAELPNVVTDKVGFKGLNGDANIRFLPTAWPSDALPAPTSSLLAVAHSKGLVVGAGPDALVISTTEIIRKAIEAPAGEQMEKTKSFQPTATIPLPARPTHVAFTPDDDGLILATENGPTISVFDVNNLTSGNAQPAISIPTNGVSLRALAPNPDAASTLVALVTVNGELLIADLKARSLVPGPNGPVLKDGVSCVAWSNKGKQVVAGLADGTGYQMAPDGTKKADIPRPPDLEGDSHVSSIAWLENDVFFVTYTPNALEDPMGGNPPSSNYIITRRKQAPFLIQKMEEEICSTMGFMMKRAPASHFRVRLRDYNPHLKDVLIVASTASGDVNLVTRSDQPLASDDSAQRHVGQYMTTELSDDTKRACVPLNDSGEDTSVIGLAPYLSATEPVIAPIIGSDITASSTPLPGVLLLNNDGILASWWFIYTDSIQQKIPYSGLVMAGQANQTPSQPQAPAATPAPAQQPAFGQPSFGSSGFGQPAFGKPAGAPAFGSPSALGASTMGATAFGKQSAPAFGTPSRLGGSPAPAFGQTSTPAPAFGTPSMPGSGPAFGAPSTPGQPQFGKSGFGQPPASASPFGGSASGAAASGGGFSSFAGAGGFSGFATAKPGESPFAAKATGESPFAVKPSAESPFAPKATGESPFAAKATGESPFAAKPATQSPFGAKPEPKTSFPPPASTEVRNPFGPAAGSFELKSSFKGDGTAVNDGPKPAKASSGPFSFDVSLDDMVSTPRKGSVSSAMSDEVEPVDKATFSIFGGASKPASQTPTSKFSSKMQTPKAADPSKPAFSMFGATSDQNRVTSPLSDKTETPQMNLTKTPSIDVETPLPPDATTRASYAAGDTSASSNVSNVSRSSADDAPLPPDFTKPKKVSPTPVDDAPLPPDFVSQKKPVQKAEDAPLPPDFIAPKKSVPVTDDAPLPPDFIAPKKSAPVTDDAPLPPDFVAAKKSLPEADDAPLPPDFLTKPPKHEAVPEDAPLPPDFTAKPKAEPYEEAVPVPDDSDEAGISEVDSDEAGLSEAESEEAESEEADGSDFNDSGEEITHDEATTVKPEPSAQSSFVSEQSSTGGFFSSPAPKTEKKGHHPRQLFGEISKQPVLRPPGPVPRGNREPYRSPSPVRAQRKGVLATKAHGRKGSASALHSRKASLTEIAKRDGRLRKASDVDREEQERQARAHAEAQLQEEDVLSLPDEGDDDRLRDELAQPVEPVDTLDPFLPHQNYMGEAAKPGIAGQIERIYRDINSMVDTLGINARSLVGFLMHEQLNKQGSDVDEWVMVLTGDQPADILDKKMSLKNIENFDSVVDSLAQLLDSQRVQGVEEKLNECRDLLMKRIVTLRGQFASIRKTLDAHTDTGAILEAPLSAEQSALQHDLRTTFTDLQAKTAALEQGVSLLRAKIADIPQANGSVRNRPTVEAVTKTIATMTSMAEGKSTDIDVLESQMRRLGIDIAIAGPPSREGSPFTTPRKNLVGRIPITPGSRGSVDGSAYHTPESASRGINFRSSVNGWVRHSRLRDVEGPGELAVPQEDASQYQAKRTRRQHLNVCLKKVFEDKSNKDFLDFSATVSGCELAIKCKSFSYSSADDAPLPPDFTKPKKVSPTPVDDAPLPPDFVSQKKPVQKAEDAPLPPDFIAPKKSVPVTDDAPLPPDFIAPKKSAPVTDDAPLPPDFVAAKKSLPEADDAPLPPDFLTKPPKHEAVPEDAPLPPDFTAKPKAEPYEEAVPVPDDSDEAGISEVDSDEAGLSEAESEEAESEEADGSDFNDSGEEITHDEATTVKPEPSAQSSFVSEQSSTGGFFSSPAPKTEKKGHHPRQLFGEISKQPVLRPPGPVPRGNREPYRSPSPVRAQRKGVLATKAHGRKGSASALHSRKASLTEIAKRDGRLRKASDVDREEQERQARAHAEAQLQEEDVLSLPDEGDDDRLRDELAQPVEPVDTLDPFLPHQNYMGEAAKPGIAGQIERIYRDINSMVDTLGINARSLVGFLMHEQLNKQGSDVDEWVMVLTGDQPADILDKKMSLKNIENFDSVVDSLAQLLDSQRVQGVEEKLNECRDLLMKRIVTLRGQFASIRKTLDAHTDTGAILEAPLSAEQSALQHDLRTTFTDLQAKTAALEQGVSLLRAKIADIPQANGSVRNRPTVEAVTKTIATMTSMAEGKSTDIDVLESQMRRLGIDIAIAGPPSREGSPFTTPRKNLVGRIPITPGSRGSVDGSAYHTPESASRGINFRSSVNGWVRHSRLRDVEGPGELAVPQEDASQYQAKRTRRQHLNVCLKKVFEDKSNKVRDADDW